jgi:uncharacterized damage-inducible protein DinB
LRTEDVKFELLLCCFSPQLIATRRRVTQMPIVNEIATAAHIYRRNEALLAKSIEGLTNEEWQCPPNDTSNSMLWVVGHVVWARSMALKFLGSTWTRPWLAHFARGANPGEPAGYPSPEEVVLGLKDAAACLTAAMEEAPAEVLSAATPEKSPSFDGKVGGMVSFLAFHEAYHVGQAAYLRRWLGHEGVSG